MPDIASLLAQAQLGAPATREALAADEKALGRPLPEDYVEFLLRFNGVDGPVGDGWLILHPVEELAEVHARAAGLDHLVDELIIGTDGGGEAFVIDEAGIVSVVPWIGDKSDARRQGTLLDFLDRMASGTIFD